VAFLCASFTINLGESGQKRPAAGMMAKLAGHVWSFDELFEALLERARQN
jgi:hypothetical protein